MPAIPQHQTRRRGRARVAGFSLIELMAVVVVLGMIAGITMVSWSALVPNQEFHTAVRRLSDVLHATRSEAIARSREFRIYYDLDADLYAVRTPYRRGGGMAYGEDDELRLWVDEVDLASKGVDLVSVTIDDETYDDGTVYVRFDPLGASSYHSVILQQVRYERFFTIESLPLTGDIRFHEGVFEREIADEGDFD